MRRTLCIILATIALYAALMAVVWNISTRQARSSTEKLLDYAQKDFRDSTNGAIDTMMTHIGEEMVRRFGSPRECDDGEMQLLANLTEVDEINIVTKEGVIIASNFASSRGYDMASHPDSAAFMILTNGTTSVFSPPFRASTLAPDLYYKYSGVPFPGGDGYVQIGLTDKHLVRIYPIILNHLFDDWLIGKSGFFLCADMRDGRLVSNPACHRDQVEFLDQTGFDPAAVPEVSGATFTQELFGELCDCRVYDFASHRTVAAVPRSEFYDWRNTVMLALGGLLFLVMGGFAFSIARIADDSECMKKFYADEEERRAKDMVIAKTIQTAALPEEPPEHPNFALHASMIAAREVGGDFYDYFMLGRTLVAFLVADVSGKGITAALYMMTAKTLIKDKLTAVRDPAVAVSRTNDELCRSNPANMFLTAWVGVLDLETGVVTYVNAGHNPPVAIRSRGEGEEPVLESLRDRSGPVMAFMPGIEYKAHKVALAPGDTLFLYTDGVTEAMDAKGELFGDDRLLAALQAAATMDVKSICTLARAAVTAFSAGVPQADDLTVLAIRCKSLVRHSVSSFPASREAAAAAAKYLEGEMDAANCPLETRKVLNIIFDEVASNIVRHSGASGFEIDFERTSSPAGVRLVFADDGVPYDPLARPDPDTTLSAAERPVGGLGIFMVKKLSDDITYRRERNRNYLSVFKRFPANRHSSKEKQ